MSSALQEIRKAEDAIYGTRQPSLAEQARKHRQCFIAVERKHGPEVAKGTLLMRRNSRAPAYNELFASLEAQIERIRELVSQSHAIDTEDGCGQARVQSDETALQQDRRAQEAWAAFEKRWNTLRDEMKEDGWLVRFRT